MSHFSGKKIAGVILSSVALLAGSIGYATTLQDQMRQAVNAAWSQNGDIQTADKAIPGLENAIALYDVKVGERGIEFFVTAKPVYNAFTLDNGAKLVVNFKETVSILDEASLKAIGQTFVKSVSAYVSGVEPEIASRLVIEFAENAGFYEIEENGNVSFLIQSKSDMLTSKMTGAIDQGQGFTISLIVAKPADAVLPKLQLSKESSVKLVTMESQLKTILAKENKAEYQEAKGSLKSVSKAKIDFLKFDLAYDAAAGDADDDDASFIPLPEEPAADAPPVEEEATKKDHTDEPGKDTDKEAPSASPGTEVAPTELPTEPEVAPMPRIEIAPVTSGANSDISSKIKDIETGADTENLDSVVLTDSSLEAVEAKMPIAMDTTKPRFVGDPLEQLVNVDFREMELSNVVALLAHKAGINVIAGTELVGVVTANLRNVTLRRAMEEALRMNGLGLVEDGGIYRIVSIQEKMSTDRVREIIQVDNAIAKDVAKILQDIVKGSLEGPFMNISYNDQKNVVIVSGPSERVAELKDIANQLDTAQPKLQTTTKMFKLNYADPKDIAVTIKNELTAQGKVGSDSRARQIIVSDEPFVVEHIGELIKAMDVSVKQVVIESMIVDITLKDDASTGVDWLLNSVRNQTQGGTIGGVEVPSQPIGSLQELGLDAALGISNPASALNFGILTDNIDWSGVVQAEISNGNGRLYSNPVIVTVENMPARITIAEEIPYIEFKQTNQGGQATNTEFKEIGTVVEVTPRVTHENDILVTLYIKESAVRGELNGIPIEAKREIESDLRTGNGQTIFMGGLRKNNHDTTVRKIPILGDIPGVNVLFRNNQRTETINELMVFMTNSVLEEKLPELTDYQKSKVQNVENAPMSVNALNSVLHDTLYPSEMRDPAWKFRRSE